MIKNDEDIIKEIDELSTVLLNMSDVDPSLMFVMIELFSMLRFCNSIKYRKMDADESRLVLIESAKLSQIKRDLIVKTIGKLESL